MESTSITLSTSILFEKVVYQSKNEHSRNLGFQELTNQIRESKTKLTEEDATSITETLFAICGSFSEGSTCRFLESLIRAMLKQSNQFVDNFLKMLIKLGRRSSVAAVPIRRKISAFRW